MHELVTLICQTVVNVVMGARMSKDYKCTPGTVPEPFNRPVSFVPRQTMARAIYHHRWMHSRYVLGGKFLAILQDPQVQEFVQVSRELLASLEVHKLSLWYCLPEKRIVNRQTYLVSFQSIDNRRDILQMISDIEEWLWGGYRDSYTEYCRNRYRAEYIRAWLGSSSRRTRPTSRKIRKLIKLWSAVLDNDRPLGELPERDNQHMLQVLAKTVGSGYTPPATLSHGTYMFVPLPAATDLSKVFGPDEPIGQLYIDFNGEAPGCVQTVLYKHLMESIGK